jgi:hypothetical protein
MKNPAFTGSEAALFCASLFPTRKHEFSELNSGFSVRVFRGSARDALSFGLDTDISRVPGTFWCVGLIILERKKSVTINLE